MFLRPFEHIMAHNGSPEVRELVLACVANMIRGRVHHIKSGWRSLFNVLELAASDRCAGERVMRLIAF